MISERKFTLGNLFKFPSHGFLVPAAFEKNATSGSTELIFG